MNLKKMKIKKFTDPIKRHCPYNSYRPIPFENVLTIPQPTRIELKASIGGADSLVR